jgi:hypothetical protein
MFLWRIKMKKNKYLAFDLEVCSWPEEGSDWKSVRPLGISCVGFMGTGFTEPIIHYAGMMTKTPEPRAMTVEELQNTVQLLTEYPQNGYQIVSWNGLQFDWNVLVEEAQWEPGKKLVYDHIDPLFQIFCTFGWPVGLQAVSEGLGLPGKMKDGVSGADAPRMWMDGTDDARWVVLKYVGKDAIATLDIMEVGTRTHSLRWLSKKGKPYTMNFTSPKTVRECLALPEKDNSWMDNPIYRKDFYSWTQE